MITVRRSVQSNGAVRGNALWMAAYGVPVMVMLTLLFAVLGSGWSLLTIPTFAVRAPTAVTVPVTVNVAEAPAASEGLVHAPVMGSSDPCVTAKVGAASPKMTCGGPGWCATGSGPKTN